MSEQPENPPQPDKPKHPEKVYARPANFDEETIRRFSIQLAEKILGRKLNLENKPSDNDGGARVESFDAD